MDAQGKFGIFARHSPSPPTPRDYLASLDLITIVIDHELIISRVDTIPRNEASTGIGATGRSKTSGIENRRDSSSSINTAEQASSGVPSLSQSPVHSEPSLSFAVYPAHI